jgi:RNA polymerase sigma factor (sigma-70 family)
MSQGTNKTGIVKEYGKKLLAFIRGRVSSREESEDILQDVWYQFYNTTEAIDQAGAWLYRVARNKIVDTYRKKKPESLEETINEDEESPFIFLF